MRALSPQNFWLTISYSVNIGKYIQIQNDILTFKFLFAKNDGCDLTWP